MKTNRNLLLWKNNTLFLSYIAFAFYCIVGWQLSEVSAETQKCASGKSAIIPDKVDVVILNQDSKEKTFINETVEHWFQYYFSNKEDDPDERENGEVHSIRMVPDPDIFIWEVYDRDGICIATGKNDSFGPSFPPLENDGLPSDIYFIRVIHDPQVEFIETTSALQVTGQGSPQVYGIIKDAVGGQELANVKVNSSIAEVFSLKKPLGDYMLHAKDLKDVLKYNLDGYQPGEVKNFDFEGGIDHLLQNVILCPNDVALTATPSSGDPLTVTFDLPDVNPEVSADYDWDFGDGMSSISPDPVSNTYSDPGTYMVNVTVSLTLPQQKVTVNNDEYLTKEIECTVESSVDVEVRGGPPPPPPPPPPNGKPLPPSITFLLF